MSGKRCNCQNFKLILLKVASTLPKRKKCKCNLFAFMSVKIYFLNGRQMHGRSHFTGLGIGNSHSITKY